MKRKLNIATTAMETDAFNYKHNGNDKSFKKDCNNKRTPTTMMMTYTKKK